MIGGVVVTHGGLAESLLDVARTIVGDFDGLVSLAVERSDSLDDIKEVLEKSVKDMDDGDGVIIFTDMFGGTPTNISLPLLSEGSVEVLTGVSLPMVLKFLGKRDGAELGGLSKLLKEHGSECIVLASEMLKGKE